MNEDTPPTVSTRALFVVLLKKLDDIEAQVQAIRNDNADTRLTCEAPRAGRFRRSVVAVVEWRAVLIAGVAIVSEWLPTWLATRRSK